MYSAIKASLDEPDAETSPDEDSAASNAKPSTEIVAGTATMALHLTEYFQAQRQVLTTLQFETGDGCAISVYTGVLSLKSSHSSVVNSLMKGTDGGSGQCISDMVVFALDMPDIRGELRDVCEACGPCTQRNLVPPGSI